MLQVPNKQVRFLSPNNNAQRKRVGLLIPAAQSKVKSLDSYDLIKMPDINSTRLDKKEIEEILMKSGGNSNLNFNGMFSTSQLNGKGLWKNVLDYIQTKHNKHYLDRHVNLQNCKAKIENLLERTFNSTEGINKEVILQNKNIYKTFLTQTLLNHDHLHNGAHK